MLFGFGSGPQFTTTFDANNHISDGSVAYDAAGNVMQDAFNKYTYDSQNHLIASQSLSTGSLTCYFYDAFGRRVQKVDAAASCGYPISGGTSLYYVYDVDGNVIDEVSAPSGGTGNWTRQEIYVGGRHLATFSAATGQAYWDFTDWLGTERARASAVTGAVVETCTSLPWGDNLQCIGTDQSPLHFTGKQRDPESGLDNFEARYLGSSYGRFLSPDDGSDQENETPQSWNLYSYVRSSPVTNTDPDGHDCVTQIRTSDSTESVSWTDGDCGAGGGTYVPGTITSVQSGADGRSIDVGYTPYSGDSGGVENISAAPQSPEDPARDLANAVNKLNPGGFIAGSALLMVENATAEIGGRVIGAGIESLLAARAGGAGEEGSVVIGKMEDLEKPGGLNPGERTLDLPNQGSPKANWAQNSSKLREAMREGKPIRDASAGNPGSNTGFLRAERNLLESHGWALQGDYWYPPTK